MNTKTAVTNGHCTAPSASRIARWITGVFGFRKTDPYAFQNCHSVKIPGSELARREGTSPHLLADIGVMSASADESTSPWRLQDGRHLLLRPPL
ncbi:hypothetical protein [Leisingera sp. S232]|uniref:hypothetical protein n=1 Tax=Leisingera sp. S232 TaxID=3415132 RepID=UPI003C79D71B